MLNLPWKGSKKYFIKIESNSGMSKQLMKDLVIEETLQMYIKATISHINQ